MMVQTQTVQPILPTSVVDPVAGKVLLVHLPSNIELPGHPEFGLIESIKSFGVLVPVTLIADAKLKTYEVVDGCRRIKAAREAGLDEIPALIYQQGWGNPAAMTVLLNRMRRQNLVSELRAVEALLAQGYDEFTICRHGGMNPQQLRRLLRLRGLLPALRAAWEEGRIANGTAEELIKLSPALQLAPLAHLEQEGKLTWDDVRAQQEVQAKAAVMGLDPALFGSPGVEGQEKTWGQIVRKDLRHVFEVLPDSEGLLRSLIAHALAMLPAQAA